jgi:hypothetical protein
MLSPHPLELASWLDISARGRYDEALSGAT